MPPIRFNSGMFVFIVSTNHIRLFFEHFRKVELVFAIYSNSVVMLDFSEFATMRKS